MRCQKSRLKTTSLDVPDESGTSLKGTAPVLPDPRASFAAKVLPALQKQPFKANARRIVPDVFSFCESEEGQQEFAKREKQRESA